MFRVIAFLLSITLSLGAIEAILDKESVANGQSLFLEVRDAKEVKAKLLDKSYKLYKHPSKENTLYAIIPVSYYQKAKKERVFVSYSDGSKAQDIHLNVYVVRSQRMSLYRYI